MGILAFLLAAALVVSCVMWSRASARASRYAYQRDNLRYDNQRLELDVHYHDSEKRWVRSQMEETTELLTYLMAKMLHEVK